MMRYAIILPEAKGPDFKEGVMVVRFILTEYVEQAIAEYSVPQLWVMIREVEAIIGRRITAVEWNELG